ncbi:ATP-dependent DNA ligase Cdc17 [Blastocladiella emersonii ATCC 22665]|nr:ATP-dependent DNA ligase Cdc17 [Blastocladiella emersonii ATCC 22665]
MPPKKTPPAAGGPPGKGTLFAMWAKKAEKKDAPTPPEPASGSASAEASPATTPTEPAGLPVPAPTPAPAKRAHGKDEDSDTPVQSKRRRVIDDDSDEDESVAATPTASMDVDATPASAAEEAEGEDDDEAAAAASETSLMKETSEPRLYADICDMFDEVSQTTKRLEIAAIVAKFLLRVIRESPADLLQTLYLCINRLCPEYEGLELGIGESILMKAIAESTGRKLQAIKDDFAKTGDLGEVAQASRGTQKTMFQPKPLLVQRVFKTLKEIANISGGSSQKIKIDKIKSLMVSCRGSEAKYLIRSLQGKLRIGLAERTVLVALAQAFMYARTKKPSDVELKEGEETLKAVYSELPCYDKIIPALLEYPLADLPEHCHLTPGIPLKPMLAHPTKAISEVLDRFEDKSFTCEYKYDGERAQIHKLESGKSHIFSRNSEDLSPKYPEVMARLQRACGPTTTSFVLDCEAVAWDREKECILPFQVLSTRKRKDVTEADIKVQVCIYVFDLLYLNGESLLRHTLKERRELLHSHFVEVAGEFNFAKSMESNTVDDIQTFLDESIVGNCEGLMVKTLVDESSYEPSKRSRNWLKVKKDYLDGVGDSLDLVVIGGYTGKGKRTGVYGGFLLACYDPAAEEYQSICKIGTGFSEEDLTKLAEALRLHVIPEPKQYYRLGDAKADVWFDPVQVWEVKTADLSISPVYQAGVGLVDPNKGISLRFPRFIRVRDDKGPEDATSADQVADMYRSQQINSNAGGGGNGGGDDDY